MKDIAGIDVVREEMEELISYLKDFQKYVRAGDHPRWCAAVRTSRYG